MRRNRLIALLMAFAVAISYLPAMAYATDDPEKIPSGEDTVIESDSTDGTEEPVEENEGAGTAVDDETADAPEEVSEDIVAPYADKEELLSLQEQEEEEPESGQIKGRSAIIASSTAEWEKTGSGTVYYAEFPSGYYTASPLYDKYNKSKITAYENANSKRTVTTARVSWIYWHWTFNNQALANDNYNVFINDREGWSEGRNYFNFRDFESSENFSEYDPNGRHDSTPGLCFYHWRNIVEDGSWWWFRIPVYKQTYTDYRKAKTEPGAPVCDKPSPGITTGTITWSEVDDADGYQIEYSTSPNFKNSKKAEVKGGKNCRYKLTGLKPGTTYYIRIRVYIIVDGKTTCLKWGSACRMKTYTKMGNLSSAKWSGLKNCTYTGKARKRLFRIVCNGVTLKEGRDYKVKYKNNTKVGTATVIIKGCGKYFGTIAKTFKIIPKGTKVSKCRGRSGAISVKWKKRSSNCSGYQVRYCTRSDFKNCKKKTVRGKSAGSCTLSGLRANTKYYIEIRTYYIVGKKTYWSGWSKCVAVRTKKAAAGAYRLITSTPTKIGSYYFKKNNGAILRSSSGNSGYTKVMYTRGAVTNGKYILVVESDRYGDNYYLVRYSVSGKNRKVVKKLPYNSSDSLGYWNVSAARGKYILLSRGDGINWRLYVYRYNVRSGKLDKIINDREISGGMNCVSGNYVLCRHYFDTSGIITKPHSLYRITSDGKLKLIMKMGNRADGEFIGKKLYYVKFDGNIDSGQGYVTVSVYSCNRDGKNKVKIQSFQEYYEVGTRLGACNFTSTSCEISISGCRYRVYYSDGELEQIY